MGVGLVGVDMSEQIKKGDLVVIVKPTPCCGYDGRMGRVFQVHDVKDRMAKCTNCNQILLTTARAFALHGGTYALSRLKKLNPPADEESRETTKELEVV